MSGDRPPLHAPPDGASPDGAPSNDARHDDALPVDALSPAAPIRAARARDAQPEPARRRRATRLVLLVGVPLLAAVAAAAIYLAGGRYVETDNAYVKADKVPLSAEVSGVVAEVLVRENESVAAGQPLFRLDGAPFRVAVARAEARLAQARTDLAAMKAGYREKQAQLALARTRHEFALKEQKRQTDLAARNFISASRLDDARQAAELAQQQIVAQQQDLLRIATELGGGIDAPIERHPTWLAAQAELQQARLDLARVEVRASLAGTVGRLPKPGQYLTAGAIAAALVADADPWVEANFPEQDLTWVRAGQPAEVRIDTWPDRRWRGVVESLSPATGAEFSILPPQNATGNWVKIAQRVPLRVRLERDDEMPALRAGLSATVRIDTGHRRELFGFSF